MLSLKLNLKRGFRESLGGKNSINEREEKEEGEELLGIVMLPKWET